LVAQIAFSNNPLSPPAHGWGSLTIMAKRKTNSSRRNPVNDPLADLFGNWRLWILGALAGALLGWAVYQIAPPDYRARATVMVDHNLEEAWQYYPDRALFQFLQRETERLEQLAWSDAVIQQAAVQETGISVAELRSDVLQLAHPSYGGWHLYTDHRDPVIAQNLASVWAQAFVDATRAVTSASPELQAARAELNAALAASEPDEARIEELLDEIAFLAEHTQGISMFVEISVSQADDLPVERGVTQATYLLAGSIVGALAAATYVLARKPI
jgi:hypothetical protein